MCVKKSRLFFDCKDWIFSQASLDDPQVQRRRKRVIFTFLQLNILRLNMFDEKKPRRVFKQFRDTGIWSQATASISTYTRYNLRRLLG